MSTEKTKGMVVGERLNESDVRPVQCRWRVALWM